MLVQGCIASGQNKSHAPCQDARQKKNPASVGGVEISLVPFNHIILQAPLTGLAESFLFGRFEQRREKPKEKQDARKYHFAITSVKYAPQRFCRKCNVLRCYLCEQKRHFASHPKR